MGACPSPLRPCRGSFRGHLSMKKKLTNFPRHLIKGLGIVRWALGPSAPSMHSLKWNLNF